MVIVADDIALPDIAAAARRRRHARSSTRSPAICPKPATISPTVAAAARAAAADIVSLGMSLSSCSIPGQPHEDRLGENEGELGLGIHGEPGVERIAVQSADRLVAIMDGTPRRAARPGRRSYALLINNLGAVPPLEMARDRQCGAGLAAGRRGSTLDDRAGAADDRAQHERLFAVADPARCGARSSACWRRSAPHAWMPASLFAR